MTRIVSIVVLLLCSFVCDRPAFADFSGLVISFSTVTLRSLAEQPFRTYLPQRDRLSREGRSLREARQASRFYRNEC
jgi:hypothetical protein